MKISKFIPLAASLLTLLVACSGEKWVYYNPNANPDEELKAASERAAAEEKLVLMVFGADWCPDCRKFSQALREPPLANTIDEDFVVMSVDVGQFDHNVDFAQRFGNPIRGGIPAFAIVSPEKSLLYVNDIGEFAAARKAGNDYLNSWFANIIEELNPRAVSDFGSEAY